MTDIGQGEKNARELATLGTRVDGIERNITSMRQDTASALAGMRQETQAALGQISNAVQGLTGVMNERARAPWSIIFSGLAVLLTIMSLMGGLVLYPMKETQARTETHLEKLDDQVVPRAELQERWRASERIQDEFKRRIDKLEDKTDGLRK